MFEWGRFYVKFFIWDISSHLHMPFYIWQSSNLTCKQNKLDDVKHVWLLGFTFANLLWRSCGFTIKLIDNMRSNPTPHKHMQGLPNFQCGTFLQIKQHKSFRPSEEDIHYNTLCHCNTHVVYFYSFLSTFYDLFVTNLISILWLGSSSPKHSLNFLRDLVFIYVHMQRLWEKKFKRVGASPCGSMIGFHVLIRIWITVTPK